MARAVLYQQKDGDLPLLALPLGGESPHQLIGCVSPNSVRRRSHWDLLCALYPRCSDAPIHLMDPETGGDRLLGTLEKYYSRSCRRFSPCRAMVEHFCMAAPRPAPTSCCSRTSGDKTHPAKQEGVRGKEPSVLQNRYATRAAVPE